jgi:GTP-binding protein EngB required for normal cell division
MSDNQQIRQEMAEIQQELGSSLQTLLSEVGNKLKPQERASIEEEFQQLNELMERLKSGLIWIALFGKTSVGKSAIANSLMGADVAEVGIEHDVTGKPHSYEKSPWVLVDVPGILGKEVNEEVAVAEAKKAHGHIFVIDGEPYADEIELFRVVRNALPETPKIVFVNKADVLNRLPSKDRETVRSRIEQKMGEFVRSPSDVVYGSAMLLDAGKDAMVRQDLPQLLDKMYEDAGTLGQVMNVLDPASRAQDLSESIKAKIFEVRSKVARKVVSAFGAASVGGTFVPYSTLLVTPGVLASMVYVLFRIMGKKDFTKKEATRISIELLKECGRFLAADFVAVAAAEVVVSSMYLLGPLGALIGFAADVAGLSYFRYRRTVILGEVTLEFIRNDCSWDGEGARVLIQRAKERALQNYMRLKGSWKEKGALATA